MKYNRINRINGKSITEKLLLNKITSNEEKLTAEEKRKAKENSSITVPAGSGIQLQKNYLELYDYHSFVKAKELKLIDDLSIKNTASYKVIKNKTARKIGIENRFQKDSEVIISAFGSRKLDVAVLEQYNYQPWENLNLISVEDEKPPEKYQQLKWTVLIVWLAYGWLAILVMRWSNLEQYFGKGEFFPFSIWALWPAIAVLITIIYAGVEIYIHKKNWINKGVSNFSGSLYKFVNMALLYIWPFVVPVAVVLFFGGIMELFRETTEGNSLFAFRDLNQILNTPSAEGLLYRLLQLFLIMILSTLPGMFYFQYERRQIETLRTQFIRNIMFLNPLIHTEDDAEIKYGKLVDEVSITTGANNRQFSILSSGRPILFATMLITLCWIFVLWPVGDLVSLSAENLTAQFAPRNTLVGFAFLGAYFFTLNLLFKRYSRGDLSPKAFSHVSIRIFNALIIVWVIGAATGDTGTTAMYIMAFGIGIMPESGIMWMKQLLEKDTLKGIFPNFRAKHPITDLEGISLYDKARLIEEGVESVETLAHHNMIELMLRSGISAARIVDLVDQAILYIHTTGKVKVENPSEGTDEKGFRRGIDILREEGIRTATDLLAVEKSVLENQNKSVSGPKNRFDPERFYTLLDSDKKTDYRMQRVLDALKDDEWLVYIKNWRYLGTCQDYLVTDPNEIVKEELKQVTVSSLLPETASIVKN